MTMVDLARGTSEQNPSPESILRALRQALPDKFNTVVMKDVTKRHAEAHFKLGPISLELNLGEITAVVGANASGKSTLLQLIRADLAPNSGKISYPALKPYEGYRELRNKIGYVAQHIEPWSGTLKDNLHYFAAAMGLRGQQNIDQVEWVIERLRLGRFVDLKWHQISGGYKLRFDLARAILTEPRLLVLDEPLSHLDVNAQGEFMAVLRSLASSLANPMCIIMASQHLYEVERVADKVVVLENGDLRYDGLVNDIGNQHPYSVFEISSQPESGKLAPKLDPENVFPTGYPGMRIVRLDEREKLSEFVETVTVHATAELDYVRDISSSSRLFFETWFLKLIGKRP